MCDVKQGCAGQCGAGSLCEATEQEMELILLRKLYERVRGFLRFNGVDASRCDRYLSEADAVVEEIKVLDSGLLEGADAQKLLMGTGFISTTYRVCHAYESGYGHGLQGDGLDNAASDTFSDPRENEAYRIGYRQGLRVRVSHGADVAQREMSRLSARSLPAAAAETPNVANNP